MNHETTNDETNNVPEFIEFTQDDVDALSRRALPKEGWMMWEVLSEKRNITKKGHYEIVYTCSPCADDNIVKSVTSKVKVYLPIANPAKEGHTPPNTKLGCFFWARATDPSFPRGPRKVRQGVYELEDGTLITGKAYTAAQAEVDKALLTSAKQWWNDKGSLVGKRFYGKNENRANEDGSVWPEISRTSSTPPNDEPLITSDFLQK